MNILVCVKRVPQTGGRIVLTADGQAIDTKFLGHTISPHEECGVEEAVRIVEKEGGTSAVLTLGPAEAEEQLRDAMAIGIERAILLETEGGEWDPVSTGMAIAEAIEAQEAANGTFDLVLFGNEAADTGGLPGRCPGRRRARAPGDQRDQGDLVHRRSTGCAARREAPTGGWETFELPLPAVLGVKEGLNLPRYPSVPGRLRAKKKEVDRVALGRRRPVRWASGRRGCRDRPALCPDHEARASTARRGRTARGDHRHGPMPHRQSWTCSNASGYSRSEGDAMSGNVLVFVEHVGGEPERLSLEALALAVAWRQRWATKLEAVLLGSGTEGVAPRR